MKDLSRYREHYIQLGFDFAKSFILHTAFELDLFEQIGEASYSSAELAGRLRVNSEALEMFLNTLVSLDILESQNDIYKISTNGIEIFLHDKPLYIGDLIKLQATSVQGWLQLAKSVRNREPAQLDDDFDGDFQALIDTFANAMQNAAMSHAEVLATELSLESADTLLDLGCGPGTYSAHFLKSHANLKVTLFDRPEILATARKRFTAEKLLERTNFIEGDFLEQNIDRKYDICFISHIIHEYDVATNTRLLAKIYNSLNSGGRLIIQDFFLNQDKQSPDFATVFSLQMLLTSPNGACYTLAETKAWLNEIGFSGIRKLDLNLPRANGIIVAIKP